MSLFPSTFSSTADRLLVNVQSGLERRTAGSFISSILPDSNSMKQHNGTSRTFGIDRTERNRIQSPELGHFDNNSKRGNNSTRDYSDVGVRIPPRPSTPYGRALVCEERCIDVDYTDENNPFSGSSAGSLRRHKPLYKLAHPVLNLKWADVSPDEASRQWCIADLLKDVDRITNELLAGVRAYRTGLQHAAKLENGDLRLLVGNINEVCYQSLFEVVTGITLFFNVT